MKSFLSLAAKVDVRVIVFILAVALFALAAGAPSMTIGIGG